MKRKVIVYIICSIVLLLSLASILNYWFNFFKVNIIITILVSSLAAVLPIGYGVYLSYFKTKAEIKKIKIMKFLIKISINKITRHLSKNSFYPWQKKQDEYYLPWLLIFGLEENDKFQVIQSLNAVDLNRELDLDTVISENVCQWFLTNRSICLNISKNIMSQISDYSEIETAKLWQYFLKCIRRYRPRDSINSILLTISISKFQNHTDDEIKRYGQGLYHKLSNIYKVLGQMFPIQLIFTECNQIYGYEEFYSNLNIDEQYHTLGFVVPYNDNKLSTFFKNYDALINNIYNSLISCLYKSDTIKNSYAIFNFPLQMTYLRNKFELLIIELFHNDYYHLPLFVNSLHLAGKATISGTNFDFFSNTITEKFGLTKNPTQNCDESNKLFVFHDFFRKNIVDSAIPLRLNQVDKQYSLKVLGFSLLLLCFSSAAYYSYFSYKKNENKINLLTNTIEEYESYPNYDQNLSLSIITKLLLNKLELLEKLENFANFRIKSDVFITQLRSDQQIAKKTSILYHEKLINDFYPLLLTDVEARLSQINGLNSLQTFAIYLMLSDTQPINKSLVISWFNNYWQNQYNDQLIVSRLNHQLSNLLNLSFVKIKPNIVLITQVREKLNSLDPQQYFFTYINNQNNEIFLTPIYFNQDLNTTEIFGQVMNNLTISSLYSTDGYQWFMRNIDGFNQYISLIPLILNNNQINFIDFKNQLEKIYFQNYNSTWQKALQNINVVPFTDLIDAENKLNIIIDPINSPIKNLLNFINYNINLPIIKQNKNSTILSENFIWLSNLFIVNNSAKNVSLNMIISQINQLDELVKTLCNNNDPNKAAFEFASNYMQTGKNVLFNSLLNTAKQLPLPLKNWLNQILIYTWQAILNNAADYINQQWKMEVWPYYLTNISNKYPFMNRASDLPLANFNQFFCNTGILDKFWQTYLMPFVTSNNNSKLNLKLRLQSQLPIANSLLNQYENAGNIRDSFCKNNGNASLNLTITTAALGNNSAYAQLDTNNYTNTYRHGPIITQSFNWPNTVGFTQTSLKLVNLNGKSAVFNASGLWGIFRLFGQVTAVQHLNEGWIFRFNKDGQTVSYVLNTNTNINPFVPNFFTNFNLPDTLIPANISDDKT